MRNQLISQVRSCITICGQLVVVIWIQRLIFSWHLIHTRKNAILYFGGNLYRCLQSWVHHESVSQSVSFSGAFFCAAHSVYRCGMTCATILSYGKLDGWMDLERRRRNTCWNLLLVGENAFPHFPQTPLYWDVGFTFLWLKSIDSLLLTE